MSDLKSLQTPLELYRENKQKYPTTLDQLQPNYIARMPTNPYDKTAYEYHSDGRTYTLSGKLGNNTTYTLSSPQ